MPAGETSQMIEATKGITGYYLISDGSTMSYRTRMRTPSFAHLQQIPSVIRGQMVPGPDRVHRLHRLCNVGCRPMTETRSEDRRSARRRRRSR